VDDGCRQDSADDFVIGTGESTLGGANFVEEAFRYANLDWK